MKGKSNKTLNSKYILLIYNILRDLGLKSSTTGTKIINKAVQIILIYDFDEFMNIQDVYKLVAQEFSSFTPNKVQSYINYAIKNRIEKKSKENFEKIFKYSYDEYFFSNKNIIFEVANIIRTYINSY